MFICHSGRNKNVFWVPSAHLYRTDNFNLILFHTLFIERQLRQAALCTLEKTIILVTVQNFYYKHVMDFEKSLILFKLLQILNLQVFLLIPLHAVSTSDEQCYKICMLFTENFTNFKSSAKILSKDCTDDVFGIISATVGRVGQQCFKTL